MNIKGGALEFDIIANNGQLNSALEESKKRVQGFSDATVEGGEQMEAAFKDAAQTIDKAFKDIDSMANIHKDAITRLEKDYTELGEAAAAAFMKGTAKGDQEYRAITKKQKAIKQEITTRKNLLKEIDETADALAKEEQALKKTYEETEKNTKAQVSLRTQLRNTVQQLAAMEQAGLRNTPAFAELRAEAGRLTDALGDAQTQAKILGHDNAGLQGVISAISGVSGGFSVAQGTVALFAGESENLQKIMLKVQSLMAITMGLQQIANTLNKDSYFSIVTLGNIKKWWNGVVEKANITENTNTVATVTNTAAQKAQSAVLTNNSTAQAGNAAATTTQTVAAKAGTLANIGLAGAFRLLGTAIKSIPVFGWIVASLTALVSVFTHFSKKAREAKKAAEEFNKAVAEAAAKPISSINKLAIAWNKLGDDLKAKEKFVEDNKDKFDALGTTVKNAAEAEKLLVENKDKFIEAQILKARALAATELAAEKYRLALEKELQLQNTPEKEKRTRNVMVQGGPGQSSYGMRTGTYYVDNPQYTKLLKEKEELEKVGFELFTTATELTEEEQRILTQIGQGTNQITEGSINALEKSLNDLRAKFKDAATDEERKKYLKQIEEQEKELEQMVGKKTTSDPFTEMLEDRKKKYTEYYNWVNSGDEVTRKAAEAEFSDLLEEGSSYLEFLKNQRLQILDSIEENKQSVGEKMIEMFGNGNVDLLARPVIEAAELAKKGWEDVGDGIATVFSSQYGILDKNGEQVEILVTPILPNGDVLSPSELEDYIYDYLEGAQNILEADNKGILISVGVDTDGEAGEILHQLQEQYYETTNLTKQQRNVLKQLNNAIASETKDTILAEFDKELQAQLSRANSVLEMLNILDERREELTGDSSELDIGKTRILDEAQEDVAKQAEQETAKLLTHYANYLSEKIKFDEEYGEKKRLLNEALAKASTDDERRIAMAALQALDNDRKKYAKSSGNEQYDRMVEEYRNFEQKKADISAEYDEKIALATEHNNEELVERLTQAKNKALSSAALEELQNSGVWEKLFSNLDDLTTSQIENLIAKVEAHKLQLGVELNPKDLEAILTKLEAAKNEIRSRNPFKALVEGIKDYGKAADNEAKKKSLTNMFAALGQSLDLVKGSFDAVVGGLDKMGLAGDDVTQDLLNDIGEMVGAAADLATGIATGNPLAVIQGGIGLLSSAFNVFNIRDRKAERAIKKHAEAVKELEKLYADLERAVNKALGDDRYTTQKSQIENLKQQQKEFVAMADAERGKKKTDKAKVEEYEQAYKDAANAIEDIIQGMREDILGGDVASIAGELGNALIDAFAAGEDAAAAWGNKVDDIVGGVIRKMLIQSLIEKPVGNIINKYMDKWIDNDGNLLGFDAIMSSATKMGDELTSLGSGLAVALESLPDSIKKYLTGEDSDEISGSLSGAIKGASQESIDLLAGQTNAVRINQVEGNEIMRNQLLHLASIDAKVGVSNSYLASIDGKLSSNTSDPLRAQGITI